MTHAERLRKIAVGIAATSPLEAHQLFVLADELETADPWSHQDTTPPTGDAPYFDADLGAALRDEAIESVDSNVSDEWREAADEAYFEAAKRNPALHNDVLWEILEVEWGVPPPHDRRALGARTRAAMKAGIIEMMDDLPRVPSARPQVHKHPMPIYKSLIYDPDYEPRRML